MTAIASALISAAWRAWRQDKHCQEEHEEITKMLNCH